MAHNDRNNVVKSNNVNTGDKSNVNKNGGCAKCDNETNWKNKKANDTTKRENKNDEENE